MGDFRLNERQRLVLNRLLDGFEGKLTTSKWAKLAMCSHDTALRDIAALVEGGVLVRNAEGGLIAARIQGSIDQYSPPEIISLLALNLRRTTLAWTVPDPTARKRGRGNS